MNATLPLWLLPLVPVLPLLLLGGLVSQKTSDGFIRLAPLAILPALIVALLPTTATTLDLDWLFFGSSFGLDDSSRIFLFLSALLWLAAAIYSSGQLSCDRKKRRYWLFFLLTASGNLGLIVSLDLISFYIFFTLMSFSAYGLIIHDETSSALRAGRIYLVLVIVGEVLLFAALVLLVQESDSLLLKDAANALAEAPDRNLIMALLVAALGIKMGIVPLHVWLPLAHPAAPIPASAILSGAMIKAGLLGLMRLLPLGSATLPGWSHGLITVGLISAFFGVTVGLLQNRAKTILAYSSISQMGFPLLGLGLGLGHPESWPLLAPAVTLYALHHGLAKGTLFLGVGMAAKLPQSTAPRRLIIVGLLLPALALAGAPLTSGAAAKSAIKSFLGNAPAFSQQMLIVLLGFAALGTTLLLARFLVVVLSPEPGKEQSLPAGMWLGWGLPLIFLLLCSAGLLPLAGLPEPGTLTAADLFYQLWPVVAGSLIGAAVWYVRRHSTTSLLLPPGDLLIPVESVLSRIKQHLASSPYRISRASFKLPKHFQWQNLPLLLALRDSELMLRRLQVSGVVFMLLLLLLLLL